MEWEGASVLHPFCSPLCRVDALREAAVPRRGPNSAFPNSVSVAGHGRRSSLVAPYVGLLNRPIFVVRCGLARTVPNYVLCAH